MSAAKNPVTFGAWVRARRKQLDLTQAGLGQRAGCSEAAIRKIEADERKPSRQLAELLWRALELPESEKEKFLQFSRRVFLDEASSAPVTAHRHNLPALLTATIDRRGDLDALSNLLTDADIRLVTLIGPPGIGKTRLSIQCGDALLDNFSDGVWFVDMSEIDRAEFFVSTLARSLPDLDLPPAPGLSQLLSGLRDKNLLLILDNFEHIVERAALDVSQLLKACPKVKALVTSRVPLQVYGEQEYPLRPLSVPPSNAMVGPAAALEFESVQLLAARIRQHRPDFAVTSQNVEAVIEICAALEGIPLALELAAATLREMSLDQLVELLRGRDWLKSISTSARDLPPRQRTLQTVIDWSYALLADEQKDIFCSLGIFSGWFDTDVVVVACDLAPSQALTWLNALANHSLLVREHTKGKTHWRLLELIREYALSRLEAGKRSRLEFRRLAYYLEALEKLKTAASSARFEFFKDNAANLHSALKWTIADGRSELGFKLAGFLYDYWEPYGYFKEGLDLMQQLFALPHNGDPSMRAEGLGMASNMAWHQHDFATALTYCKEEADLIRAYNLAGMYPAYLNRLGRIYIEQERFADAKQAFQELLELAHREPATMNAGIPIVQLGEIALFEGRLAKAKSLLEKGAEQTADDWIIFRAMAWTDLAEIALAEGDFLRARHWLERAFPLAGQHVRRLTVFLGALAGYLVLSNSSKESKRKAAAFYGAIERLSAQSGVGFNRFYQRLNRERMRLAREQLSAQEWSERFEAGRKWEQETILRQAGEALGR